MLLEQHVIQCRRRVFMDKALLQLIAVFVELCMGLFFFSELYKQTVKDQIISDAKNKSDHEGK